MIHAISPLSVLPTSPMIPSFSGLAKYIGFSPELSERVKRAACHAFRQLAVSLVFIAAAACFAPTMATITTMVSLALLSALVTGIVEFIFNFNDPKKARGPEKTIANYAQAYVFVQTVDGCRDTLVHESGHALAASCLFKNANPKITVNVSSGNCRYYASPKQLTSIGKWLGMSSSRAVISAAGPVASLLCSCVLLTTSHFLPERYQTVKAYLNMMTIQSVVRHIVYALSACFASVVVKGHDFHNLWMLAGIHPVVSALCILAVPLILKIALEQVYSTPTLDV